LDISKGEEKDRKMGNATVVMAEIQPNRPGTCGHHLREEMRGKMKRCNQ
jgi:hypothetical protein